MFTNKNNYDYHVRKHSDPDATRKKYPLNPPAETGPCTCETCGKVSVVSLKFHVNKKKLSIKLLVDRPLRIDPHSTITLKASI